MDSARNQVLRSPNDYLANGVDQFSNRAAVGVRFPPPHTRSALPQLFPRR